MVRDLCRVDLGRFDRDLPRRIGHEPELAAGIVGTLLMREANERGVTPGQLPSELAQAVSKMRSMPSWVITSKRRGVKSNRRVHWSFVF